MTEKQNYIITSLDMVTENMEDFMFSGANIFSFRLVEDNNLELITLLNDWSYLSERTGKVTMPAPTRLKVLKVLSR